MSNWGGMLDMVRGSGKQASFFPADTALPMVAPEDLGEAVARRLLEPASNTDLRYVEGPEHYTPCHVADAFSEALEMTVEVAPIPREAWAETFIQFGFSEAAAQSYACMTRTVVYGEAEKPDDPERVRRLCGTTLEMS
ncbi:hypothetical protein [Ensifer aridi]|uniref:hypothetical protein n=1 Tax=Ensifer aridi TaxID=1708715 RepID=UPI001FCD12A0|nr:hypothetical protein [Ensifer aridi]